MFGALPGHGTATLMDGMRVWVVHARTHACTHARVHAGVRVYVWCVYVFLCWFVGACGCGRGDVCVGVCVCVRAWVCVSVCVSE